MSRILGLALLAASLQAQWLGLKTSAELFARFQPTAREPLEHGPHHRALFEHIRLDVSAQPTSWLKTFAQFHEADILPGNEGNADFRQLYAELGREGGTWHMRAGRQELEFGSGSLIGSDSEWGNVGRVFDAARVTWSRGGATVDAFAGGLVDQGWKTMDRSRWHDVISGVHASLPVGGSAVSPFLYVKNPTTGAITTVGSGFERTSESEIWAVEGEVAAQWSELGHAGAAAVTLEWRPRPSWTTYATAELATGGNGHGRWTNFDELYANSYDEYGIEQAFEDRNLKTIGAGVERHFGERLRVAVGYNRYSMFDRAVSVFHDGGHPHAHTNSSALGGQLSGSVRLAVGKTHELLAGLGAFRPGDGLRESGIRTPSTTVYIAWRKRLGAHQEETH